MFVSRELFMGLGLVPKRKAEAMRKVQCNAVQVVS
jgi:hypothetical protein